MLGSTLYCSFISNPVSSLKHTPFLSGVNTLCELYDSFPYKMHAVRVMQPKIDTNEPFTAKKGFIETPCI